MVIQQEQAEFEAGVDEFFDMIFDKIETGEVSFEQVNQFFQKTKNPKVKKVGGD